ncbi:MetQ/NlpA family ABC transporter substrate-binding protein [Bacillus sp. ISL-40]|uniref:MetQ/NlpA family ABC transporter substrate-binding protein n=1 Tax=unclassified Bacillus (in: firmicutes) TaxID=185979 RepID=UPI001BE6F736|nr:MULTISPECIES: MetQ/NlpA family ABC transporter substrate-binding protein [unclassified Bacillus (in: firmicutes)]MBT2698056.1 MetQ/NlpA family ABC transporter substrate-binding protein [Bacillus sp. ISL-40]MBT2742122.1 MetQ/NlpA family ABC transporter substrate-binding protein [Bacillus sp. ISL-77]
MKKVFSLIVISLLAFALTACAGAKNDTGEKEGNDGNKKLVVGASAVPHAEVLEAAKPLLKKKGIDLEVKVFQDYILPNVALRDKELDANYFQTPGYLDLQMKENKDFDFVSVGEIHKEPIGIYSKKYKSLKDLPKGAKIIMSDSLSDHGRILPIFEKEGLIKLKEGVGANARVEDIVENPKNLDFSTLIEAKLLASSFESGEGDAVVINTNYALEGGIDIKKYGIAFESSDVVPANLVVVRSEDKNRKEIKTLVEVLHSKEIQDFILEKYKGAVVSGTK